METLEKIAHHQRILITGSRASRIVAQIEILLQQHQRHYDLVTDSITQINDAPICLICSTHFESINPHIVLIDEMDENTQSSYLQLIQNLPKSGTLVYNEGHTLVKKVCDVKLVDVYKVPYSGDESNAAKALVKRLGIHHD